MKLKTLLTPIQLTIDRLKNKVFRSTNCDNDQSNFKDNFKIIK